MKPAGDGHLPTAPGGGPLDDLAAIADALDEPAGRATFARGLVLGALVGAAIVGSVIRARHSARSRRRPRLIASVRGGRRGEDAPGDAEPPAERAPTA